jgi:phosphoserine aminotransferase
MNVPFTIPNPDLEKTFVAEAAEGGPDESRRASLRRRHARQHLQRDEPRRRRRLISFMQDFQRRNG